MHYTLCPLWLGFGTITSSKFWQVMLKIVTFLALGSIPSVFKGNIGKDMGILSWMIDYKCAVVQLYLL